LESDSFADFSVIMGDLNYRINSTFAHLSKNIRECFDVKQEQLALTMKDGAYPNYSEPEKNWLPTYKCSMSS
jgi:hypothetical protein